MNVNERKNSPTDMFSYIRYSQWQESWDLFPICPHFTTTLSKVPRILSSLKLGLRRSTYGGLLLLSKISISDLALFTSPLLNHSYLLPTSPALTLLWTFQLITPHLTLHCHAYTFIPSSYCVYVWSMYGHIPIWTYKTSTHFKFNFMMSSFIIKCNHLHPHLYFRSPILAMSFLLCSLWSFAHSFCLWMMFNFDHRNPSCKALYSVVFER